MNTEKKQFLSSLYIPLLMLVLMWAVKLVEIGFHLNFSWLGIHPQKIIGLPGIVLSPFLHGNLHHIAVNSVPFLVLGTALFYFYRGVSVRVLIGVWLLSGMWTWLSGRSDSVHIGASSLIYGLAAFLFFSGVIRKDTRLAALSMVVVFLYGSIIWGVFPDFFPKEHISWEGHLGGFLSGTILAFYYKKEGPQRKRYSWEYEDEEDTEDDEDAYWKKDSRSST